LAHDKTLQQVNRGHGLAEYLSAVQRTHLRDLKICTHLILGLPGENTRHYKTSLVRVLDAGVAGLKLHPLHVVKGTQLARQWKQGDYSPLSIDHYVQAAVDLIQMTPADIIYHRVTGTASSDLLLAPQWCSKKWQVINMITRELHRRNHFSAPTLSTPALNRLAG